MKFVTSVLIALVFLANLMLAQPSLADQPKFFKNPDYQEVTKALNNLKTVQETQAQTESYTPEETQKKIDELEFQKYALEMGINWGQCRNETGKTLAVYGPKPNFDDDDDDDDDDDYEDYNYQYDNGLYFLAAGQTTENKWDCEGVYLPSDVKTTGISPDGQEQEVEGPVAIKIADGTQLVVKTNPDTAAVELSVPPTKVVKAGEVNWFIPNVSQAVIDTRVANAPTAKIAKGSPVVVVRNLEKDTVESDISPETQSQPQPLPQSQWQPTLPKAGYINKR